MRSVHPIFASLPFITLAFACASSVESFSTDADTGSTHARITIERTTAAGADDAARSSAIAHFVRVPAEADPEAVVDFVRGAPPAPTLDECVARAESPIGTTTLGPLELLDVGTLTLETHEGLTVLAPHAMPTVHDVVSGVVYTTRDRSPLPANATYVIEATGAEALPALRLRAEAPPALGTISVAGVPLGEVTSIRPDQPLDATWTPGDDDEMVTVELALDGASSTVCAFPAARGTATIPARAFAGRGAGRIAFHRIRALSFEAAGLERAEVAFDFEVEAPVTFE